MAKIRVLIADDSALMRRTLKEIIDSDPRLEVVAAARDGKDAIEKAREAGPDVITLDINMPKMDGLTALKILVEEAIAPIVMVSSLTQEGAPITLQALEMGAFDIVAKPGGTVTVDMSTVAKELITKIKAAARSGAAKRLSRRRDTSVKALKPSIKLSPSSLRAGDDAKERGRRIVRRDRGRKKDAASDALALSIPSVTPPFAAVAIGISTGGPKTILDVLPLLPNDLPASVFLVQHMPPGFTASYADRLNKNSELNVFHAETGQIVEPGNCFVGHSGYHLTVFQKLTKELIVRNTKRPQHLFMPSADVMMESVLGVFGRKTVGVLMTGMGDDGADAMVKIRNAGGFTIAESEETSIVFGMPREAIERGGAEVVAPSWDIARYIVEGVERVLSQ